MKEQFLMLLMTLAASACADHKRQHDASDRILALSFPGSPNPPTTNLVHGTQNWSKIDPEGTPEGMLTEAFLQCGLGHLAWTRIGTDGYSKLILRDNETTRSAVKCAAKTVPFDFYVEPQRASKSELATLIQTPQSPDQPRRSHRP